MDCNAENAVQVIDNQFIILSDGIRLSAKLWLPGGIKAANPVPAILEFLPYRKRDMTIVRDDITYTQFALKGYAGVRVDMRGSGDSTGEIQDEYVLQEQEDALEVIQWIRQQPWCDGSVGMMGISWGGFNSLQVAHRQPEGLKAIISLCFTDDRFSDDIHFKGGAMLMENIRWAASMEVRNCLPPDPLISNDWKEIWLARLEKAEPILTNWLSHSTRDQYWKHGSICEDYSNVKAATFLIGGYADGYTNTVERTLRNIDCPKRALIGPWVHLYPHIAVPGPQWGFCDEAVKWWDKHLGGKEMPEEPETIAFIQNSVPVPCPGVIEGRWVCDPQSEMKTWYLSDGKIGRQPGTGSVEICTPETCGAGVGAFFPVCLPDISLDQTSDDTLSCAFDTEPFTESTEILGRPVLTLSVASDSAVANIFVRLCLIDPKGVSRLVSFSAQNLNHDVTHECVTPLTPDQFQTIDVQLDYIGERIDPGYKLRLCLSSACFPMFLPNPEHVTLTVDLSQCQLQIPVLVSSCPLPHDIPPIDTNRPESYEVLRKPKQVKNTTIESDGRLVMEQLMDSGSRRVKGHGLIIDWVVEQTESILPEDPTSAESNIQYEVLWCREDWKVKIGYSILVSMDKEKLYTNESKTISVNDEIFFQKSNKLEHVRHGF